MAENPSPLSEQIDRASLLERVEGDQELLTEIVQLFQQDAPEILIVIREALQRGDLEVLERSAHSLKGAAGNLSAKAMAAVSQQLEKDAKSGDAEAMKKSFADVERVLNNLLAVLPEICEGVAK